MPKRFSPTRRGFLKASAATAGVAVATPYIITSKALGDAVTPPASDRIVMGGIGLGNMGSGDQRAFLGMPEVQYVAVCDVREKYRNAAKVRTDETYGTQDCAAIIDFRDLLGRDDIDAVHIATPDHWHSIMMIAACRSGKDVYLQKPETLTLREGPLMIAAARRYGRVVSGGSQRVLDDYRSIVDPCWAGELGRITTVDLNVGPSAMACHLPGMPTPDGIDWDLWLGPAPWQPYNPGRCDGNYGTSGNSWRSYVDYSGGSLTDWGAHNFGGTIFAAGLLDLQPQRIIYQPASADGRRAVSVALVYPNGVEIHCNRHPEEQPRNIPSVVTHERGITIRGDGQPVAPRPVPAYKGAGGIHGDFIACVKTRERPFRDIEIGVNTMTGPHMVALAGRLQRSLAWDRDTQRFVDDDEANRLLDRARREPWTL